MKQSRVFVSPAAAPLIPKEQELVEVTLECTDERDGGVVWRTKP
jgi:hypothetical protein